MSSDKVKVLYIVGWGRSGSTIIDRILGQAEGFVSLGEMRYIWDRNFINNQICGCGKRFRECDEWSAIVKRAYGSFDGIDPVEMIRYREEYARTRHLLQLLLPNDIRNIIKPHLEAIEALYRAIKDHFGCRVIIDSSKFPSYAYLLDLIPSIDLHLLHLVRDPRAVAFSWLRTKLQPDTGTMEPMGERGPFLSTLLWDSWNLSTEIWWGSKRDRYHFLRYEDFVDHPHKSMKRVLRKIGEDENSLTFTDERTVVLGMNHTVSGNPNRFEEGPTEIRLDDEWRNKIRLKDRALVTALASPLLKRYKYSFV